MDLRVIITAAGSGTRFGQTLPKQFSLIGTESILKRTIRCFEDSSLVSEVTVVLPPGYTSVKDISLSKVRHFVAGKKTRAESVYEGLKKCQGNFSNETVVLVHDGVRPFVSAEVIKVVAEQAFKRGAAIAAVKVTDTIKKIDPDGYISATIDRKFLWKAATPQGFRINILVESYKRAMEMGYLESATDEAFLAEKAGFPVYVVEGNPENIKITTQADKLVAEAMLRMLNK